MLQILRKKAQSTFIQIIVVIIALVFIFWGVGTNLNNSRQAALTVNGEEITFQQFQQAYDQAYQRLGEQFGGNVPKGLAESLGIKQQVINQLIQGALLRQGAAEMGIVVSNQEIRDTIQKMVQFQENGGFSMDRYKSILAANRMAPSKFEKSMQYDRLSEVAAREIGRFAATTTNSEIQEIYSQLNEKVAVNYVTFSPADYKEKVEVDDDQLATWFETVKANYKTAPELKLKYLTYTFDEVGSKIQIDEAAIDEYYQSNIDSFKIPEKRKARHILFRATDEDSEEVHAQKAQKAEEVRQMALSGKNFADLAKEYSEGPSKATGGDLGSFTREQMVGPFADAVFSMDVGKISDVVKTRFGYHIINLEGIEPPLTQPEAAVRQQIIQTLQEKQAETLAFQVANEAYEAIISNGSLKAYGENHPEAQIHEAGFFSKDTAPDVLKKDPKFMTKAFELSKGELSSLIKGDTGYAIFFVEDIKEPVVPALDTIKEKVVADFRQTKSRELAKTAAEQLLSEIEAGKELTKAAEERGFTVKESGMLTQNPQNGQNENTEFPAELTESAFQLSSTSPLPEKIGEAGDLFYVYSFQKREVPTMPEDSKELEQYRTSLLRFKQQQLLASWLRHMEIDAEITKHQNL